MRLLLSPELRLTLSVALGVATFLLVPESWKTGTGILAGWDAASLMMIVFILSMMSRSDATETYKRSQQDEPSNMAVLLAALLTSLTGLGAVAYGLTITTHMSRSDLAIHTILSIFGVFSSWFLIHIFYALHYAKSYYDEAEEERDRDFVKGLEFPGDTEIVDYWDFVYYSFTIAMCYQTSDVTVVSAHMRRITIVHAIISFLYVIIVLGLMVNIINNFV